MLKFLVRYKFSLIVAILIVLLSLIPGNNIPDSSLFSIPALDKIAHMCLYALLSFTALMESHCQPHCLRFHILLLAAIFSLSAFIEILQATVVATRSAEWLDLLANFTGLCAGYAAFRIFRWFRS
jgi:VanZ family protein